MRRIAIGDPHLSGFRNDAIYEDGLPTRLYMIKKAFTYILDYARSHNIHDVDILGDLHNDKSQIYTDAQDVFREILIKYNDINFVIISGNHDLSSIGENQKSTIEVFNMYPNVTCVSYTPEIVDGIAYVPYTRSFTEDIKQVETSSIIIAHLGLNEGVLQSGLSKVDKVSATELSRFKLALLGHYHKPQELSTSNTNIWYAGSLINASWNDKNEQRRFLVYDTDSLEVESVNIEGLIEYKEFIIDDKESAKDVLQEAQRYKELGHNVRIKNLIEDNIGDIIQESNSTIDDSIILIDNKEVDITNRGINVTQSKRVQCENYLEIKEIENKDYYLNTLLKYDIMELGVN